VARVDFWRDKRVFVTGHTGFKGSWLLTVLSLCGAKVVGYARPPDVPGAYGLIGVDSLIEKSVIGDVCDSKALEHALRELQPDIVFHLAAQSLVRLSYEIPVETYATNVMGTVHLFEAIRKCPSVRAVVIVTSDKCYENHEWTWGYRESDAMGGHDPYSNSKGCVELVTSSFRRSFFSGGGTHIASARAGNIIGGGDFSRDRLVPDLVRSFKNGEKTRIRNPSSVRPWQHVLEPVFGYLALAERLYQADGAKFADGWNFGPEHDNERPVQHVVETLCRLWGGNVGWVRDEGNHVHEAGYLRLDSSKSRQLLGWRPLWSFETMLEKTAEWYRAAENGGNVRRLTEDQIGEYQNARTES
jgi:CDP-glucose 4,6-dehydratase